FPAELRSKTSKSRGPDEGAISVPCRRDSPIAVMLNHVVTLWQVIPAPRQMRNRFRGGMGRLRPRAADSAAKQSIAPRRAHATSGLADYGAALGPRSPFFDTIQHWPYNSGRTDLDFGTRPTIV